MESEDKFDVEGEVWWKAEKAWLAWLSSQGYIVTHLGSAIGNSPLTQAPMIMLGKEQLRAPDVEAKQRGTSTYWEVKYRTRATVDSLTGTSEHWMSYESFADYDRVDQEVAPVHVALFEAGTTTRPGRWLQAPLEALREQGREELRHGRGGEEVLAWVWPASAMEPTPGPMDPDVDTEHMPVFVDEGADRTKKSALADLAPIERTVRRARRARQAEDDSPPVLANQPVERAVEADTTTGLDVLRRVLGIPELPQYSVLRIGLQECDVDQLVGLLDYGIRLFLVTGHDPGGGIAGRGLEHFRDARLIEWAELDEDPATQCWVVDGNPEMLSAPRVEDSLAAADGTGQVNVGQYRVVHAPADADVIVTAGAGTGKTETMSERLVYVLSVGAGSIGPDGRPSDLRPSDVALITFTNDAAREIRARLSRTLMLRRRLCPMSVQPLAWLLEIGAMQVTTIHTFAKQLVQRRGAELGLSPSFTVSQHLMAFRRLLQEQLSDDLSQLLLRTNARAVPAAHLWERYLEKVWAALGGNGIDLTGWGSEGVDTLSDVDWGLGPLKGLDDEVMQITKRTIEAVAGEYAELCRETDTLATDALVPTAIAAIEQERSSPGLRILFVDEFQDTDPMQMRLVTALRKALGANVFVVGDAKQGIYRFRGAEGNAFDQFVRRFEDAGLQQPLQFQLSWNFRTHVRLLDSLHRHFAEWAAKELLPYDDGDRLKAARRRTDPSGQPLELVDVDRRAGQRAYMVGAAADVAKWRSEHPDASIAILCRTNRHAIAVHRTLRQQGDACELVVGGDFFQTEAVREFRALLEAVTNPHDDAALLELAETRWLGGLYEENPHLAQADGGEVWLGKLQALHSWQDRLATDEDADFQRGDLGQLRARLIFLRHQTSNGSTLEWLVECIAQFQPQRRTRPGDEGLDRVRYLRCLDHVVTLLDDALGDSPVTLERILGWLRLKVDTRYPEDEPMEREDVEGTTTALTVHKAKGLEFDLVLIPNTWAGFKPHSGITPNTAVIRQDGQPPRLALRWSIAPRQVVSNVGPADESLWDVDHEETSREEARLLYVALTRAKARTKAYRTVTTVEVPDSWSDLLAMESRS